MQYIFLPSPSPYPFIHPSNRLVGWSVGQFFFPLFFLIFSFFQCSFFLFFSFSLFFFLSFFLACFLSFFLLVNKCFPVSLFLSCTRLKSCCWSSKQWHPWICYSRASSLAGQCFECWGFHYQHQRQFCTSRLLTLPFQTQHRGISIGQAAVHCCNLHLPEESAGI